MMKLVDKGRFAPPPKLEGAAAQRVAETVGAWDGILARTHWLLGDESVIDGVDFYVGEEEVGHVHLYSEAHVVFPRVVAVALIQRKLARSLRWNRNVGVWRIETSADVDHALWLFRLSYDHGRGAASVTELLARIADRLARGARAPGRALAATDTATR